MPDYRNHAKGNLRFKLKEGNTEIVVATHGGYTPRRHRFNMFGIR
jgi:uncharacterized protein YegP (UPF0339 family)